MNLVHTKDSVPRQKKRGTGADVMVVEEEDENQDYE